jgi:hypothetical protein
MKTIAFIVEIQVSDKISDDNEINEMSQNIADAIVHASGTAGICPEASEAYTEIVYVKGWYSDKQIIEHTL